MKGFTEKDGVLVIIFANNLIYKWQKFQPSQTSPSVFPLEIAYLVQKLWNFWYQVKILVFLHHLQKEWVLFYLKWAWNECLHLRTSEMSIDMGRRIVQWTMEGWDEQFFYHGYGRIHARMYKGLVVWNVCTWFSEIGTILRGGGSMAVWNLSENSSVLVPWPSWLPYSTYLYLDIHLCSMTKLKEHSREIC